MQTCVQDELKKCSNMQTCVQDELKKCSYMQTCVQDELRKCSYYMQTCVQEVLKQCSYIHLCSGGTEAVYVDRWVHADFCSSRKKAVYEHVNNFSSP